MIKSLPSSIRYSLKEVDLTVSTCHFNAMFCNNENYSTNTNKTILIYHTELLKRPIFKGKPGYFVLFQQPSLYATGCI